MESPRAAGIRWASAATLVVSVATGAAAQDCRIEYQVGLPGGGFNVVTGTATRGETKAINQSDVQWIVNKLARDVSVQVTIPTGGTKWVPLSKDQRDPPLLNYLGNVSLQQLKCEYHHASPVAMYTAVMGTGSTTYQAGMATVSEFNLSGAQLLQHLQPHLPPNDIARILRETHAYSGPQVAVTFKQRGYSLTTTRDALWASSTDEERRAQVPSGVPTEAAILKWLKSPYSALPAAQSMVGYDGDGLGQAVVGVGPDGLLNGGQPGVSSNMGRILSAAGYTNVEAASTIRQLASGPYDAAEVIRQMMGATSFGSNNNYPIPPTLQAVQSVFGLTPAATAQALISVIPESYGYARAANALTVFSQSKPQIATWLMQAGLAPNVMFDAMFQSTLNPTLLDIVPAWRSAGVSALQALQILEARHSPPGGPWSSQMQGYLATFKPAGYPADEVGAAMVATYPTVMTEPARLSGMCFAAGYDANECVSVLRTAFPGEAGWQIALRLRRAGDPGYANDLYGHLMVKPELAAAALKTAFGATSEEVAGWFVTHWMALEQAVAIHRALTKSPADVAAWMKSSGRPLHLIGGSMWRVVTQDRARVAAALLQAQFTPAEAAKTIRNVHFYPPYHSSLSSQAVAEAMRDGGFPVDAIVQGVTAEFPGVAQRDVIGWICGTSERGATITSPTTGTRSTTSSCQGR